MRWRQDRETGKLIEVGKTVGTGHFIRGAFVPYVSPVDGTVIRTRSELTDHNKRNGVSNDLDSLREQTQRSNDRTHETGKHERKLAIKDAMERMSSSGYHRRVT